MNFAKQTTNCDQMSRKVLNDDVLTEIFSYLSVNDLIKVSKLSDQFSRCADQVLKQIPFVKIGVIPNAYEYDCVDCAEPMIFNGPTIQWPRLEPIHKSMVKRHNRWYTISTDLIASEPQMKPLFTERLMNVKSLVLNDIIIDEKVVRLISQWFPRLQCLTIGINTYTTDNYKCLNEHFRHRLRHLHLNAFDLKSVDHLNGFDRLEALSLIRMNGSIPVGRLADTFAPSMITLNICMNFISFGHNIGDLITHPNVKNVRNLSLNGFDYHSSGTLLSQICANMKLLKRLSLKQIRCRSLAPVMALQELEVLEIQSTHPLFADFKTSGGPAMKSLRSLSLLRTGLHRLDVEVVVQSFPNLQKLWLTNCCLWVKPYEAECGLNCVEPMTRIRGLQEIRLMDCSLNSLGNSSAVMRQLSQELHKFGSLSTIKLTTRSSVDHKSVKEFIDAVIVYAINGSNRWITCGFTNNKIEMNREVLGSVGKEYVDRDLPQNLKFVTIY